MANKDSNLHTTDGPDRTEFNNWLMNRVSKQSSMISRAFGEKIIQYLRDRREKGVDSPQLKAKYDPGFRFNIKKRRFQLINVVGLGDILCLPVKDKSKASHAMLGQHRQVIFKEDMFDVIDNAHKNTNSHRGYKGTFRKINATYCNIPREIVHKYVNMCTFCRKAHACFVPNNLRNRDGDQKIAGGSYKKIDIEMDFLTRCQIDVLDMQGMPDGDGQFRFIGHFIDHHTKYSVLFPLKHTDAFYVARKLCRYVFGHFGLPQVLHSNLGRKYVDEVIQWVLQLWSTDAHIINGSPRNRKLFPVIQQRQKTILVLIETIKAKQAENTGWSSWLPGIQYSLNTNQFEPESGPAFESVYKRPPKVYSYAPTSKEIPKEEDVVAIDRDNEMGEVITVSVSDFIQSGEEEDVPLMIASLETESDSECQDVLNKNAISARPSHQCGLKGTTALHSDLLSTSTLGSVRLSEVSLPKQYTIIGHAVGVNSCIVQIPVVSLSSGSVTRTDSDAENSPQRRDEELADELQVSPTSLPYQRKHVGNLRNGGEKGDELLCVRQEDGLGDSIVLESGVLEIPVAMSHTTETQMSCLGDDRLSLHVPQGLDDVDDPERSVDGRVETPEISTCG